MDPASTVSCFPWSATNEGVLAVTGSLAIPATGLSEKSGSSGEVSLQPDRSDMSNAASF